MYFTGPQNNLYPNVTRIVPGVYKMQNINNPHVIRIIRNTKIKFIEQYERYYFEQQP